ncbi:MAG: ribosomal RNA small subunit methyltransferase A, partial [Candidatus Wildermuthbacteria bacterium]|nr:ribosomal RNA small subunit methyltransferase A [Candidatus Wildermuthbacteria bacterium]
MDILSSHIIRRILSERGFSPKKRLGQNFLTSASVRDAVVEAGAVSATDTVLEIGPGLGALTRALIRKAGRVVAVEKDKDLFSILQETFGHVPHLTLLNRDILSVSPEEIVQPPYKVVANLPYSITSPVIRMFLETAFRPSCMALMVQKEVAKRICAPPPSMTLLAASVQYYASPRIARTVKKTSFWPVPAVDSAILVITPFPNAPSKTEAEMFFSVVRAGFL